MWITLFFVYTILLVSTEGANDCVGYSVDKCAVEDGALIETIKDIDEEDCQFYCNVIYGQNCTFYIYDKKQVVCEVFRSEMKDYIDSCKKYGGPPDPSVAQCLSSHNECKVCCKTLHWNTRIFMIWRKIYHYLILSSSIHFSTT